MNQHVRQDTSGQPTDLRCEYQRVPLGIDTTTLRCSWKLPEDLTAQRAYALTVRAAEGTIIWESGEEVVLPALRYRVQRTPALIVLPLQLERSVVG